MLVCVAAVNSRSSRAKVWVRTRPTANFAHGMINFHPDGKVASYFLSLTHTADKEQDIVCACVLSVQQNVHVKTGQQI